jgi:hypothetical protein
LQFAGEKGRRQPPMRRGTMPTIDELVASMLHLPPHHRARRMRERLQCHVRRSLVHHQTATPAVARQALHLWNDVATPLVTLVAAPCCCRGAHITVGGHHAFNRHVEVPPPLLTVNSCIKVHLDLQADKSPVVVKGPFFPRVVNPRYRIRGTMCNARIQSSKAR